MYTAALLRGEHGDARSLWDWGIATRSGWWRGRPPADPDRPRLSAHFGSQIPADDWFFDLSLAFQALHATTAALTTTTDLGWYIHTGQCSREQLAIWLYYVEGMGHRDFRQQFSVLPQARKNLILDLMGASRSQFQTILGEEQDRERFVSASPGAYPVEDGEGDELVARHIPLIRGAPGHVSRRRANELRLVGIDRMALLANHLPRAA